MENLCLQNFLVYHIYIFFFLIYGLYANTCIESILIYLLPVHVCIKILTQKHGAKTERFGGALFLQNCSMVLDLLRQGHLGPCDEVQVDAYRETCHSVFPYAIDFRSQTTSTAAATLSNDLDSKLTVSQDTSLHNGDGSGLES